MKWGGRGRRWGQRIIPLSKITRWADWFVRFVVIGALIWITYQVVAAIATGRIPLHGGAP